MNGPFATLTASLIEEAWRRLSYPNAWPDVGSGFSRRLLEKASLALPDTLLTPFRPVGAQDFRRAPDLAGFGFVLETELACDPALHRAWASGLARLTRRDPFPPDRQSFAYDPLELLGIALGAASCPDAAPDHRAWLLRIVRRAVEERHLTRPLAELGALCAAHALVARDPVQGFTMRMQLPPLAELSMEDLCFAAALATLFPDLPAGNDLAPWRDPAGTAREIMARALREPVSLRGIDAATVYVCMQKAVDRMSVHPEVDADATTRVAALCRRFQLFVDRLRLRQRGRPPFDPKDEYDVQDLLHAVLRLHFDDVRPEEWTPSYAGKASRVDFFLPRERTVVEAKMTRPNLGQKEVGDQLIIDKERYRNFSGAEALVCFVYDPERRCPNPAALEADLAEPPPFRVTVVVCPRGI